MREWLKKLGDVMEHEKAHRFFSVLIVLNAIILGLETFPQISKQYGDMLLSLDKVINYTFVIEIALRLIGNGWKFFKSGWNIFDFIVIGATTFAFDPAFSAFRTLRILRLTEIMSLSKSMKIIVNAMAAIIPGMFHMFIIIALIFYIFALVGHDMFAASTPELFGSLGKSMMTLLLILLGDGIGDAIQATMQTYEFSYMFFVVYIAMMSFTLLNMLFGIIVDAVQSAAEKEVDINDDDDCDAHAQKLMQAIKTIGKRLDRIEKRLEGK